jgi:hypothetical protein
MGFGVRAGKEGKEDLAGLLFRRHPGNHCSGGILVTLLGTPPQGTGARVSRGRW